MDSARLTIDGIGSAFRAGEMTSAALVKQLFARADLLDASVGSYLFRSDESALAAAALADAELREGVDRGPLHGIPIAIKDIVRTADAPTTAQSLVLDRRWGMGNDAPVVARLRAAGAIIMGKTSTMEFAIGLPDPAAPFPVPRNPWNLDRWAGGSSSGTANGIVAGLFVAGVGTDTGGSIRVPSAFCGTTGMKPTFGLVPKSGVVPLAHSMDHVGPMARTAKDCALMLEVMTGYDASDPSSVNPPHPFVWRAQPDLRGIRVGVEREHHIRIPGAREDLTTRFEDAVDVLNRLGAILKEVSIERYDELTAAATITFMSEGFAYHRANLQRRWGDYGCHTAALLGLGALFSAADYVQAQRVRAYVGRQVMDILQHVDVIVSPTAGEGANLLQGLNVESVMGTPVHTAAWSALGFPALSVPMGFSAEGLPLGLQVAGRPFDDALVLRVGDAYQHATAWHRAVPPLAVLAGAA